ncbi:3-deoxy-D-manno-octulosonic acid kinase [Vibrio sp. SCSIO 43137]|uniref:3-deoxy-D-manno-octulosonic acid kinase n=1 Tax=Vibrio sp. SCSIO 43137 TaxID=3021011 RepID=UPI0023078ECF|nr:3-deoxy-D-manno-octulosonic acid kinase [Vibrio sp. SCSIO 43137]WCE29842.1 3-deoxy-D-manno-octulosonic acid kinase [Vibrio sp. SCSIO 43137]
MKELKGSEQRIWYDETLLNEQPEKSFDIGYWQHKGLVLGSAQGRGTTWFVQLDKLQAALRHYRRGGLFGKIVKDHYWFSGWKNSRSYQEYLLLQKLIEAGVSVPRPVAARTIKKNLCYQADLLSEKIENAQDLVSVLQQQVVSEQLYHAIGTEVRKMHDVQVNHTDLNIHNILIDNNQKVWLIDFDKCSFQQGNFWKQSNLNRLKRSFNKEKSKRNIFWQESDFEALLDGYRL